MSSDVLGRIETFKKMVGRLEAHTGQPLPKEVEREVLLGSVAVIRSMAWLITGYHSNELPNLALDDVVTHLMSWRGDIVQTLEEHKVAFEVIVQGDEVWGYLYDTDTGISIGQPLTGKDPQFVDKMLATRLYIAPTWLH